MWATDPETGESSAEPVTDLILGDGMKDLVRIGTDADGDGVIEWVTATDGHPFWVDGGGWTDAGELAVGDVLVSDAGEGVEVAGVAVDTRSAVVHNLTVNRLHTYYVTYGDTSVLSHNDSCELPESQVGNIARHASERGHYPNKSLEKIKQIVRDTVNNGKKSIRKRDGSRIYNKGPHRVIANPNGRGTVFRPGPQ